MKTTVLSVHGKASYYKYKCTNNEVFLFNFQHLPEFIYSSYVKNYLENATIHNKSKLLRLSTYMLEYLHLIALRDELI